MRVLYPFRLIMHKMLTKSGKLFNYVIFYMSSIKSFQFLTFFWQFLIFGKIQDSPRNGGILDDVTAPPPSTAARQPIICTSFCIAHHKLSTKGEIFSKYCNEKKTQGESTNPPLPPLYHGGGVTLLVRPRVKLICFV